MGITHATVATGTDAGTGEIHKAEWNAEHTLINVASWNQDISEDGTSYANFTTIAGTWSSDGTIIKQTDTTAAFRTARHNTKVPVGYGALVEAEIRFPTTGQGGGSFIYGAIMLGNAAVILDKANQVVRWQDWAVTDVTTKAFTIALDTWYKLRVAHNGYRLSVIIDGTYFGTVIFLPTLTTPDQIALGSYGSLAHFRNVKAWTLSGGAPS